MLTDLTYLYVEDDALNREALSAVLTRVMGIKNLIIFEDSANFMERVRALPDRPGVFLLDVQIYPHDGFEMLRMLRESTEFSDARIVAVTASVMNEEVEQLRRSGFDGCLGKPLNLGTLRDSLERIIRGEKVWQIVD